MEESGGRRQEGTRLTRIGLVLPSFSPLLAVSVLFSDLLTQEDVVLLHLLSIPLQYLVMHDRLHSSQQLRNMQVRNRSLPILLIDKHKLALSLLPNNRQLE